MLKIKNPIAVFVALWLFVLYIYSKRYSLVLTPLSIETFVYILSVCLSFTLAYYTISVLFFDKKLRNDNNFVESQKLYIKLRKVFKIWFFFTLIEIAFFRGLPLLAILGLGGDSGRYTEWGIPSLHGFLNAMIITISNYLFYFYLKTKNKKYLWLYLSCVMWPILLITRQMLMSMVVQAAFIYILSNNIKTSSIIKVVLSAFGVVYLFGIVGDLRSGGDSFIELVQPSSDYPTWLPSGVLWVYVYMVSPLNNVNFNLQKFPDFYFDPSPLISPLFPSFVREKIFSESNVFNFQLVNENLNVSTMFPSYLTSFGYYGSLIFYFILGLLIAFIYFKFRSKNANLKWLFVLGVIFHNLIFSVFVDFFFNLVFLFQFVLHFYISSTLKFSNDKD